MDTLSLLLSMGNVSPHSDVLVVDMVGGILTGAVAERLGGLLFGSFISIQFLYFLPRYLLITCML